MADNTKFLEESLKFAEAVFEGDFKDDSFEEGSRYTKLKFTSSKDKRRATIQMEDLVELVAASSGYNKYEVRDVTRHFIGQLIILMCKGDIVHLKGLCQLFVNKGSMKSPSTFKKGKATLLETPLNCDTYRLRVTPDKTVKDMIRGVTTGKYKIVRKGKALRLKEANPEDNTPDDLPDDSEVSYDQAMQMKMISEALDSKD